MKKPNFYAMAAGEFTSGDMDDSLHEYDDLKAAFDNDDLCAWQPFENLEVLDIHEHICDLAARLEDIYYLGKRDMFLELDGEFVIEGEKEIIEVGDTVWYDNDFNRDLSFYDEVMEIEGNLARFEDGTVATISRLTLLKVKD